MKYLFVVFLCITFISNVFTQNTQEQGTFFLGGGLGKSWSFSPSINVNQSIKEKSSLLDDLFAPQLSAKIGYVFANHFAFDLNAERFLWTYNNLSLPLTNDFLYARFGIFGMDKCFKTSKSKFAITWLLGLSGGPVISNNKLKNSISFFEKNALNGFGTTALVGFRFEFNKRFYILFEQTGGVIYQKVRGNDLILNLTQPYLRTNLSLGVFIFERWKESCNTCPKW